MLTNKWYKQAVWVEMQVLRPSRSVFFRQQFSGQVTSCSIVIQQKCKNALLYFFVIFSLISTTRMSNFRTRHQLHISQISIATLMSGSGQVALMSLPVCYVVLRVWSGLEIFQKLVSWFKSWHRNHTFSTSLFTFLRKEKWTHDKLAIKLAVYIGHVLWRQSV